MSIINLVRVLVIILKIRLYSFYWLIIFRFCLKKINFLILIRRVKFLSFFRLLRLIIKVFKIQIFLIILQIFRYAFWISFINWIRIILGLFVLIVIDLLYFFVRIMNFCLLLKQVFFEILFRGLSFAPMILWRCFWFRIFSFLVWFSFIFNLASSWLYIY